MTNNREELLKIIQRHGKIINVTEDIPALSDDELFKLTAEILEHSDNLTQQLRKFIVKCRMPL